MSDFFSYDSPAATPAAAAPAAPQRAILGELSSEDWEVFIGYTARRRYPAGARIHGIGDSTHALCFVASGAVELQGPQPLPTPAKGFLSRKPAAAVAAGPELRGEGGVFGVLSFLDGAPSAVAASVSAAGPAELLLLSPEALQQLAAWQPRIAMTLMRDLGAYVAARLRALQPAD